VQQVRLSAAGARLGPSMMHPPNHQGRCWPRRSPRVLHMIPTPLHVGLHNSCHNGVVPQQSYAVFFTLNFHPSLPKHDTAATRLGSSRYHILSRSGNSSRKQGGRSLYPCRSTGDRWNRTSRACHVLESSKLLLSFSRHLRILLNAVSLLRVIGTSNGADLLVFGH
jgi:hypothetical protein